MSGEGLLVDVCIVCALAEEAQAFLDVVSEMAQTSFAPGISPLYRYEYRFATIGNNRGERLTLYVSWLPRYGPQEMALHLPRVLQEFRPRFAAMTGICAEDKRHVALGDLIVAERTFTFDAGSIEIDADGQRVHRHDTQTYQPDENTLSFARMFDQWKPLVAQLVRPPSKRQQRDWLLNRLLDEQTPSVERIPQGELEISAPAWRRLVHELQRGPDPLLSPTMELQERHAIVQLRYGVAPFPYTDPQASSCFIKAMASSSAVHRDDPFSDIQIPVRGAVAVDMEGAAFGRTMASFPQTRWLIVKGVSDYADSDKDDSYHRYASSAAARYLLCFIKEYVTNERLPPFPDQGRHVSPSSEPSATTLIDRLRRHTRHTLDLLSPTSAIVAGTTRVKIPRRCAAALRRAAENGSLVVTGSAGSGKSVVLCDVVTTLLAEGRDVIFLTAEEADSAGLTVQPVVDALEHWEGDEPAFLVIDALDSTRFGQSDQVLRTLLARVARAGTRWRVIAAIRSFDLSYDDDIQRIFAGTPPDHSYQERALGHLRHLAIPSFTEEELDFAGTQAPALAQLLSEAQPQLRTLLMTPFNLRLAGELLQEGVGRQEFTPLRTQVQLLDRYWVHYITRPDGQRAAREFVLRHACEEMLAARTLRVERVQLSHPSASQALEHLLHSHLLVAWQGDDATLPDDSLLAFSHRILFDYAVARLLLSGSVDQLVRQLEQSRELCIVIRPSIVYRFQQFWLQSIDAERTSFWRTVLRIQRERTIPTVGKLIGPSVAATFATDLPALQPLLAALQAEHNEERDAGEAVLRHLIGALIADQRRLGGESVGPWCTLAEHMSQSTRLPVLLSARVLLSRLVEQLESLTEEQCCFAGQAARRLLAQAWKTPVWDPLLRRLLLEAVCRTYGSDPSAARASVRRCLEYGHLSMYGDEELLALAEEIPRLAARDPELLAEIYSVAFSYEETSEEATYINRSQLLALRSTRRQDYESALDRLAEQYPAFLREAPLVAVRTLIAVLDASDPPSQEEISSFDFLNARASIRIRLDRTYLPHIPYEWPTPLGKMLSSFSIYLGQITANPQRGEELQAVLALLGEANLHGVLWRRVVMEGVNNSTTFGYMLRQLTWTLPLMSSPEVHEAITDLIASLFTSLDVTERERVEQTICSVPTAFPQDRRTFGEYIRDRLVRRLPLEALVTEKVRQLAAALAPGDDADPLFLETAWCSEAHEESGKEPFGEDQRVTHRFIQAHMRSAPTLEECEGIIPHLRSLFAHLESGASEGQGETDQHLSVWRDLSGACQLIAGCHEVTCSSELGTFVCAVLLRAASLPWPSATPGGDEAFDKSPAYGGEPRECAAIGLTWLARHQDCTSLTILEAICQLSGDRVATVRYLIAFHARQIYRSAPETMWQVLEERAHDDPSNGVLQGVLDSLKAVAWREPDQASQLAQKIFEHTPQGAGAIEVRKDCAELFAALYLYRNHALSGTLIFTLIEHSEQAVEEVWQVLAVARKTLTYGAIESPDEEHEQVRQRGWDLLRRTVSCIQEALGRVDALEEEERREQRQALYRLANTLGSDLYHASGAADANLHREPERLLAEKRRFLAEAEPLLDELSTFGMPSLGHSLAQTLAFLVPANPARVLPLFSQVVLRVAERGYSYEPSAVDLVVRVVERYLAEYREVLQQDAHALRLIIEVVDHFVDAGWPAAWQLVYRLDTAFF